jgi:hypothetical protein
MGHVEGHDLAQTWDLFAQGLHGLQQQGLQHGLLEAALFLAQPASAGHGALDIEARGLADIQDGTKAQFQQKPGMLHEKATQARTGGQVFLHLEQQRLDVGALGVGSFAGLRGVNGGFRHHMPLKERKEGAGALHDRVMFKHEGQGLLVKGGGTWYDSHDRKLLAAGSGNIPCFDSACKLSFCQGLPTPLA